MNEWIKLYELKVAFKNCPPSADWISEINNIKVNNSKDLDVIMPIFNLMEYIVIIIQLFKTSGSSCQYCRDEQAFDSNANIVKFGDQKYNWFN